MKILKKISAQVRNGKIVVLKTYNHGMTTRITKRIK